MLTQKTFLAGTVVDGLMVRARFDTVVEKDGVEISRSNPHLVGLMPDSDADVWLAANNADLVRMGREPIAASDWQRVLAVRALVHTDAVKAAFAEAAAQREAARKASNPDSQP